MTPQEQAFLEQTIDRRGNVRAGSGRVPRYDGWFCDLFYQPAAVKEWNPTITDVHTYPDPFGEPVTLQVGVGDVHFCVLAVNSTDTPTAYVGPVYSYYEFHQPANERLDDARWQEKITANELPRRPDWTKDFQVPGKERTVDALTVLTDGAPIQLIKSRENRRTVDVHTLLTDARTIQLIESHDNRPPTTQRFAKSDRGIAQLVAAILARKTTDRISLDLSRMMSVTEKSLDELKKLRNLTHVSLRRQGFRPKAIDDFRKARPDVDVRLEQ
jgi:hypothetical protein